MTPEALAAIEQEYGIDQWAPGLLHAVMIQESGGNPKAVSPAGARGLFQFMPATAKEYGVDVNDPESSARGAAKYLSKLYKDFGSVELALAGYNAGPGNVRKAGNKVPNFKETQDYVARITGNIGKGANTMDPVERAAILEEIKALKAERAKLDRQLAVFDNRRAGAKEAASLESFDYNGLPPELNKALATLGGGMHATIKGAGQLLGIGDKESVEDKRERDAPLQEDLAGKATYLAGEILPTLALPGMGSAARAGQGVLKAARAGALEGGVVGATQMRGEDDSLVGNIAGGALGGGGAGAAISGAGKLVRGLSGRQRAGEALAELTGGAENIRRGVRAAGQELPGAPITTAEALAGRGGNQARALSTGMAEKSAARQNPRFAQDLQAMRQEASDARFDVVRRVANTEGEDAARAARSQAIEAIEKRIDKRFGGKEFDPSARMVRWIDRHLEKDQVSVVKDFLNHMRPYVYGSKKRTYSGYKTAMDEAKAFYTKHRGDGSADKLARYVKRFTNKLDDVLSDNTKGLWRKRQDQYASMSRPINKSEIFGRLQTKLGDAEGNARPITFNRLSEGLKALREPKSRLPDRRDPSRLLSYPEEEALRGALQNAKRTETALSAGRIPGESATAQNLAFDAGSALLGSKFPGAGMAARMLRQFGEGKVAALVEKGLLNPQEAIKLIERSQLPRSAKSKIIGALLGRPAAASAGLLGGGGVNALLPATE